MVLRSFSFGFAGVIFLILGFLNGVRLGSLFNLQAMIIVFGGMLLVAMLGFSRERIKSTWHSIMAIFKGSLCDDEDELLMDIFRLASIYRIHGPLALERAVASVKNEFLRYGAIFVAEGYDEWSLANALERELHLRNKEALSQVSLIKTLMRLAPSLGMAGTVISLMQVMGNLDALDAAGPALAVALSSTLYGVLIANLLLLPISAKLEQKAGKEFDTNTMIIEALLAMTRTEHPMKIADRFNAYNLYQKYKETQGAHSPTIVPVQA